MVDLPQPGDPGHQDEPGVLAVFGQQHAAKGEIPEYLGIRLQAGMQFKHGASLVNMGTEMSVPTLLQRGANLKPGHGPTDEALAKFGIRLQEEPLQLPLQLAGRD